MPVPKWNVGHRSLVKAGIASVDLEQSHGDAARNPSTAIRVATQQTAC